MRIALTGNPNSGKTTMFNALTGRNEKVGNWAGVTVDKKEHAIKKSFSTQENVIAVDLPGAYSMSPFTSEESITSSYVKQENPDAIINIVDATNLSRSLFFTTQLLELGIPVVVALNKSDINEKKGNINDKYVVKEKFIDIEMKSIKYNYSNDMVICNLLKQNIHDERILIALHEHFKNLNVNSINFFIYSDCYECFKTLGYNIVCKSYVIRNDLF